MFCDLFTAIVETVGAASWSTVAETVMSLLFTSISGVVGQLFDSVGLFTTQSNCTRDNCPGSFYMPIAASWANIGYMTHADFVHFVWNTSFGLWAALFYAIGAVGALISVSINQPPRTYMWFFLGPAIYSFLVGTPETVQGVAWRIANRDMSMEEVWRDAETGLANTALVSDLGLSTSRREGPDGTYQVAWAMAFLDGLFSETTNNLVSWIGMQRQEGRGGTESNLFNPETEEGPWQLLANLKWGMVENIVGASARDPDVRAALATFLTSECGDQFKKGVNSGAYSAAAQSRGSNLPSTVFIGADPSTAGLDDDPSQAVGGNSYSNFVRGLDTEAIPTPRSMVRLFNSPAITGSFRQFSEKFSGTQAYDSGRLTDIVCSEYLYMLVQAMRWEGGHAYHQLLRGFPDGFQSAEAALKTLFYGWNLRPEEEAALIEGDDLIDYTKHLILVHMIRNELMYAPQVTEQGQRFAPAEQARNYTEGYIRQQGSRAKYGELYQWAVMMPHVQGILAYLVLIGYPFAAMLMVVPGYWKVFFTWISFFAWVKLWDVGFAIVHTLERSVWAMIGNHSSMARVGRRLIQTAQAAGSSVSVECPSGSNVGAGAGINGAGEKLSQICSVPEVKEMGDFGENNAWFLFDQAMLLSGSLDLDLSNGYYIYIMSALYFAVPTVTGQLVLGAKAGLGGIATQALGQSAQEAGGAAKSGTVGENSNRIMSNQGIVDQAGKAQSYRQTGLAKQTLDAQNAAMNADIRGAEIMGQKSALEGIAAARKASADSVGDSNKYSAAVFGVVPDAASLIGRSARDGLPGVVGSKAGPTLGSSTSGASPSQLAGGESGINPDLGKKSPQGPKDSNQNTGSTGRTWGEWWNGQQKPATTVEAVGKGLAYEANLGFAGLNYDAGQAFHVRSAYAGAAGQDFGWQRSRADLSKSGFQSYSQGLSSEADYEAGMAAYDAKAAYAAHMAGAAGVTGMNPGGLNPGAPDGTMRGLAAGGALGKATKDSLMYGGFGFQSTMDGMFGRNSNRGANLSLYNWRPMESVGGHIGSALVRPGSMLSGTNPLTGQGNSNELAGAPEEVQGLIRAWLERPSQ